jgi:hypothetical protein
MDLSVVSHPAWPALLGMLLMLELLAQHREHATASWRTGVWLLLAGGAAGTAFAFKQNVGAFAVLGGSGWLLMWPSSISRRWLLLTRALYVIVVAGAVHRLLAPDLDELLAFTVWLPLLAGLILVSLWSSFVHVESASCGLIRDGLMFACGLLVTTLAWLVPLMYALGPDATPVGLFIGQVNQGALRFPLEALPEGAPPLLMIAVWLPLSISAFLRGPTRDLLATVPGAGLASVVALALPLRAGALNTLGITPGMLPTLDWLDLEFGTIFLYVPALIAWSAMLLVLATGEIRVVCLVLVGVIAQVALFPRADASHALLAGAPLLVVSAWVLARVHRRLAANVSRPGRAALFAALLIVPVAAAAPHTVSRLVNLVEPSRVRFGVAAAPVMVPVDTADELGGAVRYMEQGTPPGEPLFAYPVDPLVNVLTDRPNPTRFDHFLPGALSPEDMHAVVGALDTARPRFVLWDHAAVVFWETDKPNRIISDYIWSCYRQVATFGLYLVLERSCP